MKFKKKNEYEFAAEKLKEDMAAFLSIMPQSVKIDNVSYKVKEKDVVLSNLRSVMGSIDYGLSEIEIAKEISLENKKIVIAHEVVHGITVERDIKNLIPAEHYEKVVEEMAKGFVQVVRDNPDLIKFIK
ncbi:MAG: hypothetical protein A2008_12370 [Candidatus Wallbacteria bacterium GWC2_49_35]|uniref:Uncharacterized protein n=1 Tax=Candidatus Wallbacteria bacterium GWC2_49_35 TaxID=1817813 RepID=A0A1F7X027_9BACT|nr:MAG: hypothetical protein A2008_12370 [Candidatus Wallbacteria bacterium GWC2_49_35]